MADITAKKIQSNEVIQELYRSNVVKTNPITRRETLYLIVKKAGLVSGGGSVPLINNDTKKLAGVSSFDNMPLPEGKTIIIDAIRIRGSVDTTASVQPANATFKNAENAIEPALRNSDFIIHQDGDIFKAPIRRLSNVVEANDTDADFMQMIKPITILSGTAFNFRIESAVGATPVTDGYLLIEFDATVVESGAVNNRRLASAGNVCG